MVFLYVGCILAIVGAVFLLLPSKKKNPVYGYRSAAAEKSPASWCYAQKVSGLSFLGFGLGTALIGLLLKMTGHTNFFLLEMILVTLPILLPFGITEDKLKIFNQGLGEDDEHFDD